MATAAPPAINLAKANPAKHDQTAKLANEPTGELADVDMAPAGPAKSAPTPQPTAKAKEPGQTQTGSKDSTSTSSHSDATGSISMQQENPKIQKNMHKCTQKTNTNAKPDDNNASQGYADTTPPSSTSNPTREPNTNAQANAPAEQATANTNPWQSGSSLADKLSKKKSRTMRTVLPNEEDTQRLFELAKAARTDKAKRLEHFEFIKAVNLKLGWDMMCDTPLIIPVPEDLRATRLEVAECINTEQTDPIVLEMIRQRTVGKVHFQQYRRRVVLWLKDEGTKKQLQQCTFNIMGHKCKPRSKAPLDDSYYIDIVGMGYSPGYIEVYTKFVEKGLNPIHITPKDVDASSSVCNEDIRIYFASKDIPEQLQMGPDKRPIQQLIFNLHKYPVKGRNDNTQRVGRFRDASDYCLDLDSDNTSDEDNSEASQHSETSQGEAPVEKSTESQHSLQESTPKEKLTEDISNAGSEYIVVGRKRKANKSPTLATDQASTSTTWHSPNLFELLEDMQPSVIINPPDNTTDTTLTRCPLLNMSYKKVSVDRSDAKITQRLKKATTLDGRPAKIGVNQDDWSIQDIVQTMVSTADQNNSTKHPESSITAKQTYLKLASKLQSLAEWEKCLEHIREQPLGGYLALDHIRRTNRGEYETLVSRHFHQRLQSATFHTDVMNTKHRFQMLFKRKHTTRDNSIEAFSQLTQQLTPTQLQTELFWAEWDLLLQCIAPKLYNCDAWVLYFTKHKVNWLPTQHMRLLSTDSLHRMLQSSVGVAIHKWLHSQEWNDSFLTAMTAVQDTNVTPAELTLVITGDTENQKLE
ncbi:unnamed protein product [Aphanomyces euteiches]